jgi:hypothetical protein
MYRVWESGEVSTEFCWGNLLERDYLEDTASDRRIILNCRLKYNGESGQDSSGWRLGRAVGCFGSGKETWGSIK